MLCYMVSSLMKEYTCEEVLNEFQRKNGKIIFGCSLELLFEEYIFGLDHIDGVILSDIFKLKAGEKICCLIIMNTHSGDQGTVGYYQVPKDNIELASVKTGIKVDYELLENYISVEETVLPLFEKMGSQNFIKITF